jgi:hypothetical protein
MSSHNLSAPVAGEERREDTVISAGKRVRAGWLLLGAAAAGLLHGSAPFAQPAASICVGDVFCHGFEDASVMPGTTPAPLGLPSPVAFNGLALIADTLHHVPRHAVPAAWDAFPAPLADAAMPSVPQISVLNRRDAVILYLPAVQGAADYRAWLLGPGVTFAGSQPRGAVVACAGYRQRFVRSVDAVLGGSPVYPPVTRRELLQAIELPGLVANGDYRIVVEAIASPCPFPGVMAHSPATIPLTGGTVPPSSRGAPSFAYRSFDEVRSLYGNEILNGQGSTLADYKAVNGTLGDPAHHQAPAEVIGRPVPPNDPVMPADPAVIARSVIRLTRPAADEAQNAPVFDVGPNATFDDFDADGVMTSLRRETRPEGAGLVSGGAFGNWFFWMIGLQPASNGSGGLENGDDPKGVQFWRRHGRLYGTKADFGQEIWGHSQFASTQTLPHELDAQKYVHSFFRVDSGASQRRYWTWMMCGGATREELVDVATRIPKGRAVGQSFYYDPGGDNPTAPRLGEATAAHHNKECLNLIQLGAYWNFNPPTNATSTWFDEPHSQLRAFIHPAGQPDGVINLKPDGIADGDAEATGGMSWRLNAARRPTMPMFEPFDQQAPLTHYDVFVRPDRVVFYVNGRQAWCGDLSDRPLAMKYGLLMYGDVLYHSSAETPFSYVGVEGYRGAVGGSFHYVMNTPWADTRIWDAVGHSEKIDIPPQFAFDPATCFKPKSTTVR